MINGISHITFIVKDLIKTSYFFKTVFDAEEIYSSDNKIFSLSEEKFLLINDIWIVIMEGDSQKTKTYNHIAFSVSEDAFTKFEDRVKMLDLEIKTGRKRIHGEARSLYFYDYDNHLFEIHTGTLEERLNAYSNKSSNSN